MVKFKNIKQRLILRSLFIYILISTLFSHASIFSKNYSMPEIEIGNLFQYQLLLWGKSHKKPPSFIELENLMRSSGCYVSYHRCFYKNRYYSLKDITTNSYPKINISKIKKHSKGRAYTKKINSEKMIYLKKENNNRVKEEVFNPILHNKDTDLSTLGLKGPGCYSPKQDGTVPCLPDIKSRFSKKPFPSIGK